MHDQHFGLLKYWLIGSLIWIPFMQNSGWDTETLPLFTYCPPLGALIALVLISWTLQPIIERLTGRSKRL